MKNMKWLKEKDIYNESMLPNDLAAQIVQFPLMSTFCFLIKAGVVGWCEGAVYLTSPGCPADIGLQLGKACYSCSR